MRTFSQKATRFTGDAAVVNVHHDSFAHQLIVQRLEGQSIRCVENHAPEDTTLPSTYLHNDGRFQRSVCDPRRCV